MFQSRQNAASLFLVLLLVGSLTIIGGDLNEAVEVSNTHVPSFQSGSSCTRVASTQQGFRKGTENVVKGRNGIPDIPHHLMKLKISSETLSFGNQSLFVPKIQDIMIENPTDDEHIIIHDCKSSDSNLFKPLVFGDDANVREDPKVLWNLQPQSGTRFQVVFLPQEIGLSEASLVFDTSVGVYSCNLHGFGVDNEYKIQNMIGDVVPVGEPYQRSLRLYNSFPRSIRIQTIFTTENFLFLQLPHNHNKQTKDSSLKVDVENALSDPWEIRPGEDKIIANISFQSDPVYMAEGKYRGYVRVKIIWDDKNSELDPPPSLLVPFEISLLRSRLHAFPSQVDFGTIAIDDKSPNELNNKPLPPLTRKISLLNFESRTVKLTGFYVQERAHHGRSRTSIVELKIPPKLTIDVSTLKKDVVDLGVNLDIVHLQLKKFKKPKTKKYKNGVENDKDLGPVGTVKVVEGNVLIMTNSSNPVTARLLIPYSIVILRGHLRAFPSQLDLLLNFEATSKGDVLNVVRVGSDGTVLQDSAHFISIANMFAVPVLVLGVKVVPTGRDSAESGEQNEFPFSIQNSEDLVGMIFPAGKQVDNVIQVKLSGRPCSLEEAPILLKSSQDQNVEIHLQTNISTLVLPVMLNDGKLLVKVDTNNYPRMEVDPDAPGELTFDMGSVLKGTKHIIPFHLDNLNTFPVILRRASVHSDFEEGASATGVSISIEYSKDLRNYSRGNMRNEEISQLQIDAGQSIRIEAHIFLSSFLNEGMHHLDDVLTLETNFGETKININANVINGGIRFHKNENRQEMCDEYEFTECPAELIEEHQEYVEFSSRVIDDSKENEAVRILTMDATYISGSYSRYRLAVDSLMDVPILVSSLNISDPRFKLYPLIDTLEARASNVAFADIVFIPKLLKSHSTEMSSFALPRGSSRLPTGLSEFALNQLQMGNEEWRSLLSRGKNVVNTSLILRTTVAGTLVINLSVPLLRPSVFSPEEAIISEDDELQLTFGLTHVNQFSEPMYFTIKNPSGTKSMDFRLAVGDSETLEVLDKSSIGVEENAAFHNIMKEISTGHKNKDFDAAIRKLVLHFVEGNGNKNRKLFYVDRYWVNTIQNIPPMEERVIGPFYYYPFLSESFRHCHNVNNLISADEGTLCKAAVYILNNVTKVQKLLLGGGSFKNELSAEVVKSYQIGKLLDSVASKESFDDNPLANVFKTLLYPFRFFTFSSQKSFFFESHGLDPDSFINVITINGTDSNSDSVISRQGPDGKFESTIKLKNTVPVTLNPSRVYTYGSQGFYVELPENITIEPNGEIILQIGYNFPQSTRDWQDICVSKLKNKGYNSWDVSSVAKFEFEAGEDFRIGFRLIIPVSAEVCGLQLEENDNEAGISAESSSFISPYVLAFILFAVIAVVFTNRTPDISPEREFKLKEKLRPGANTSTPGFTPSGESRGELKRDAISQISEPKEELKEIREHIEVDDQNDISLGSSSSAPETNPKKIKPIANTKADPFKSVTERLPEDPDGKVGKSSVDDDGDDASESIVDDVESVKITSLDEKATSKTTDKEKAVFPKKVRGDTEDGEADRTETENTKDSLKKLSQTNEPNLCEYKQDVAQEKVEDSKLDEINDSLCKLEPTSKSNETFVRSETSHNQDEKPLATQEKEHKSSGSNTVSDDATTVSKDKQNTPKRNAGISADNLDKMSKHIKALPTYLDEMPPIPKVNADSPLPPPGFSKLARGRSRTEKSASNSAPAPPSVPLPLPLPDPPMYWKSTRPNNSGTNGGLLNTPGEAREQITPPPGFTAMARRPTGFNNTGVSERNESIHFLPDLGSDYFRSSELNSPSNRKKDGFRTVEMNNILDTRDDKFESIERNNEISKEDNNLWTFDFSGIAGELKKRNTNFDQNMGSSEYMGNQSNLDMSALGSSDPLELLPGYLREENDTDGLSFASSSKKENTQGKDS